MADLDRLQQDLGFVRGAVTRATARNPVAIYFLWSVVVLCGFILVDLRPRWVGPYWMVAGPLGGLVSGYLGWRDQVRFGQLDRAVGMRWVWHWFAFLCTVCLLVVMAERGRLPWEALNTVILLVLALTYVYAGLHLSTPLLWIGLLAAGGSLLVLSSIAYAWSALGVLLSAACAAAGLREWRSRVVA